MNHKRRSRRRGGIKGCCAMCASQTRRGGLRNQRLPSMQEQRGPSIGDDEGDEATGVICRGAPTCARIGGPCQDECQFGPDDAFLMREYTRMPRP